MNVLEQTYCFGVASDGGVVVCGAFPGVIVPVDPAGGVPVPGAVMAPFAPPPEVAGVPPPFMPWFIDRIVCEPPGGLVPDMLLFDMPPPDEPFDMPPPDEPFDMPPPEEPFDMPPPEEPLDMPPFIIGGAVPVLAASRLCSFSLAVSWSPPPADLPRIAECLCMW